MTDNIRLNALRAYALGEFDNTDLDRFGAIAVSPRAQILHIIEFPLENVMTSETENWLARQELSQAIREAWKAGLEVEDREPIECPTLVQGPRVFFYDKDEKSWKATLLCLWLEDRQMTRFYTFHPDAVLPPFVKVA